MLSLYWRWCGRRGVCRIAEANLGGRGRQPCLAGVHRSDLASRPPGEQARVMRRWADLIDADAETLAPLEAVSTRPHKDVLAWHSKPICVSKGC